MSVDERPVGGGRGRLCGDNAAVDAAGGRSGAVRHGRVHGAPAARTRTQPARDDTGSRRPQRQSSDQAQASSAIHACTPRARITAAILVFMREFHTDTDV